MILVELSGDGTTVGVHSSFRRGSCVGAILSQAQRTLEASPQIVRLDISLLLTFARIQVEYRLLRAQRLQCSPLEGSRVRVELIEAIEVVL